MPPEETTPITTETPETPVKKPVSVDTGVPQDKVNEIAGKAREEGRATAMSELLKELGLEKVDDLKKVVTDKKQADDAAKSEAQRLLERAEKAEKLAQEAEAQRLTIHQERMIEKRDTRIVKALEKERARDAEDLLILMDRKKPELVKAVMKEDGTIDEAALTKFVAAVKIDYKDKFVGGGPGSPSNAGGKVSISNGVELKRKVQA